MTFRDAAQGAYRMRQIGRGQTITILSPPTALGLVREASALGASQSEAERAAELEWELYGVNKQLQYYEDTNSHSCLKHLSPQGSRGRDIGIIDDDSDSEGFVFSPTALMAVKGTGSKSSKHTGSTHDDPDHWLGEEVAEHGIPQRFRITERVPGV